MLPASGALPMQLFPPRRPWQLCRVATHNKTKDIAGAKQFFLSREPPVEYDSAVASLEANAVRRACQLDSAEAAVEALVDDEEPWHDTGPSRHARLRGLSRSGINGLPVVVSKQKAGAEL